MVRLVFRPYTQLRRSICTSESLRSSIRVSPDFNLARHSSPSFGSQRACSCCSARCEVDAKRRDCARGGIVPELSRAFAFTAPLGLGNPMTRTHVRLLGPCFKTGRRRRRPTHDRDADRASERHSLYESAQHPRRRRNGRTRGSAADEGAPNFTRDPDPGPAVRRVNGGRKAAAGQTATPRRVLADPRRGDGPCRQPEPPPETSRTPPFTTTQFHVLLNSLFKVLFNFPSRYLFAIGLGVIFSLTWSLPRALSCTPKQLDSGEKVSADRRTALRAYHPLRAVAPVKVDLDWSSDCEETLPNTTFRATRGAGSSVLGSARFIRHY